PQVILWDPQPDLKLHNIGFKTIPAFNILGNLRHQNHTYWINTPNGKVYSTQLKTSYCMQDMDPERRDTRLYWGGMAPNLFQP
ncbi:hypothetical protein DD865_15955, partial [Staphylococcus pseudintermedius]